MTKAFPSISGIIPDLKSGDDAAWTSLVEKFRSGLISKTRYLISRSNLEESIHPEDIVQDVLLKAWRHHESFRGTTTAQFAKWILTILRHKLADLFRLRTPEFLNGTWFEKAADDETPSKVLVSLEQEARLHACLAELEPDIREILVLRHFEGLKFREMAERSGRNINTLVGIYKRGLSQMARELGKVMNQND